jgi:dTDP-4-amino-4,6-dideoxy-D-glucose acyltransferase
VSFYSDTELREMGFEHIGVNVKISRHSSLHGIARISIGDYSRIDDFTVISAGEGGVRIGRFVHIAVMCSLIGKGDIEIHDFANLSSRVSVYSSSDDYSGAFLTNPTVPVEYLNVDSKPVYIGRHCIIGSGSVVLPGSNLRDGVAVGALSLVKGTLEEFTIYSGCPVRPLKSRSRHLLELEAKFSSSEKATD